MIAFIALLSLLAAGRVQAHASMFHPAMYGFNVTAQTFPYDNRPVTPLYNYTFAKWWFHGLLAYPPNDGDFFELPAGQPATSEIACDKGATSYYASSPGGDVRQGDSPCPNSPTSAYHSQSIRSNHQVRFLTDICSSYCQFYLTLLATGIIV